MRAPEINREHSIGDQLTALNVWFMERLHLIRHAILNDIAIRDFQIMSIIGMALFFLGKQYGYFVAVPKIRKYIIQNTLIVLSLGGLVIFLPRVQYILVGLTATMICYVFLNFRYRGMFIRP
ncbi:hypothetical protein F6476_08225 [Pseudomonas umsongensis]|nr:hypothetical protein F6476_08225 [Pseudomonas umsongensis]